MFCVRFLIVNTQFKILHLKVQQHRKIVMLENGILYQIKHYSQTGEIAGN